MRAFIVGILLGAMGGLFAIQNHVVRTKDGVIVVARTARSPVNTAFVDVRDWSSTMWLQFPDVAAAVVEAGRSDLIAENALGSFSNPSSHPSRSTPATITSNGLDTPMRLLQGAASNIPAPATSNSLALPQGNEVGDISPFGTPPLDLQPLALPLPVEVQLGPDAPFPIQYLHAGQEQLVLPSAATSSPSIFKGNNSAPLSNAIPRQRATPPQLQFSPMLPPAENQTDRQNPEWMRGLLRSLVPTEGTPLPAMQGATTGISNPAPDKTPPPATASEIWKSARFQQLLEKPMAPVRALRPL